jgi:3-dehydroquinate synthase
MITDPELFKTIEDGYLKSDMEKVIVRCVNIKRKLVFQDEYDRGSRQLLNFGHTFGHAIEKCSDFGISHGHAVAIGMAMMAAAAEKLGIAREKCSGRLRSVLKKSGLPDRCDFGADELTAAVLGDKKRSGDSITVVVPVRTGKCVLHPIPVEDIPRFIRLGLEQEDS